MMIILLFALIGALIGVLIFIFPEFFAGLMANFLYDLIKRPVLFDRPLPDCVFYLLLRYS